MEKNNIKSDGRADIAMVGLAVMGANLALNMERHGYTVTVWNHEPGATKEFMAGRGKGKNFIPAATLTELVANLVPPRKIMMMIRAGEPVDRVISQLMPLLDPGDIVIDGGNSRFEDTARRCGMLLERGLLFIGSGVSGGEEGALYGPSLMPGGAVQAWPVVRHLFESIAARSADGTPCCGWIGPGGSGHFVKMVHNGIEYADMQLICEAYDILRKVCGCSNDELNGIFTGWSSGELASYLMEITAAIFTVRENDGSYLVDRILDKAAQKNTGIWAVESALELGNPLPIIAESVFARMISARRSERIEVAAMLGGPLPRSDDRERVTASVRDALLAARIVSYAQAFSLISDASANYGWGIDNAALTRIWRGGCIIRSALLDHIALAFDSAPDLGNLLLDRRFAGMVERTQDGWRSVVSLAALSGVPVPAFSSALAYYDSYRCGSLPANLLQAQRDYFGAHTYRRTDRPESESIHTEWKSYGKR